MPSYPGRCTHFKHFSFLILLQFCDKIPGHLTINIAPAETKENVCGSIDQALKLSIKRSAFCIFPAFYNPNVSSSISTNKGPFHFMICHLPYREKLVDLHSEEHLLIVHLAYRRKLQTSFSFRHADLNVNCVSYNCEMIKIPLPTYVREKLSSRSIAIKKAEES